MNQKNKPTTYFFILGNNPALSLAEIFGLFNADIQDFALNNNAEVHRPAGVSGARIPARKQTKQGCLAHASGSLYGDFDRASSKNFALDKNAKTITFCKDFLIVELDKKIDANKLIELLGGTIKIGVILENPNVNIEARDLIEEINIDKNKKFYFGFSAYGKLNSNFKQLAMGIKNKLQQGGVSSRWVVSREKQLSSVVVKKNKLIGENGAEWCVLKNQNEVFWGRTLAVQEFENYGKRDFSRPKRDTRSGMIPPKLAKIMINLAQSELNFKTKNNITLLDPFCGSGTILQEAAILGINKFNSTTYQLDAATSPRATLKKIKFQLIGSDLSKKAAQDSKQNLKWLEGCLDLKVNVQSQSSEERLRQGGISILHSDVRKLSGLISADSIDLIVTEPYLGPPLTGRENKNQINKIVKELSELYLSAFEEFKKILKESGCVCMVWPVFVIYEKNNQFQKNIFLPILDEVRKIGFKQIAFEANNYTNLIFNNEGEFKNFKKNLAGNFSENGNIIYGREGQMVKREIVIFKL